MSDDSDTPPSTDPVPGLSPLDAALLREARALVPEGVTLRPGDTALDPVYGGRIPDAFDSPAWRYYQERVGPGKSGGTTCGVTLAYLLGKAGWPADMVNRDPSDPYAPGGGFSVGMHIARIVSGAERPDRRWYRAPGASGDALPRPGDAYHVDHPPKLNSDHVGVVESVSAPRADGTRAVTTIDGGQGTGADVKRNERVLSADGRTLTLGMTPARVRGWIRASAPAEA